MTIQRVGVLDLSSNTERTIPETGDPSMVNLVFSPDMGIAAASRQLPIHCLELLHAHCQWSRYA